jgi:hypothetical protein
MAQADPQAAFRAGLLGEPLDRSSRELGEAPAPFARGPNEEVVLETRRMPGLGESQAAFEVGRLLRAVARLFDQAGAPAVVGQQFRDNLAAAIITHAMRRTAQPWVVEDAVDMFMEMYARILSDDAAGSALVRKALLGNAKDHGAPPLGEGRRSPVSGGRAAWTASPPGPP